MVGSTVAGRVVVITGGGTGIGAAIAERYAAEGARVVVVGRRIEPLQEVEKAVGAKPIVADAADTASAKAAVAEVLATFGRIDVLVANAGDVYIAKAEVEPQMVGVTVKFTPLDLNAARADVQKISKMVVPDVAEV